MDAILLAAGNSSRFGKNKLLYRLAGRPMYRYMLELLYQMKEENRLEHLIVVSQYEEIFRDIQEYFPGTHTVRNPAPELGISGSVRLGIEFLEKISENSGGCLFAVADQPYVSMESLIRLWLNWKECPQGIVAASHGEQIGNPVIFSSVYYEELKSLKGDVGGKRVLRRHMDDTRLCEIPAVELRDLDTLESVESDCFRQREAHGRILDEKDFPFLKESGHVISIVGAGGKTTLMYSIAESYAERGKRVIVTTTTHIFKPEIYPVAENQEELKNLLGKFPIVAAGEDAPEGKLKESGRMSISDYQRLADVVVVEADGAKHFPCKIPIETEPVIPGESDIILGVMGLDTVGRPLREVCFRREKMMEFLAVDETHCMTEKDVAYILSSDCGTRKNVGGRSYYVVLNKCDNEMRYRQGERIRNMLVRAGISNVISISLNGYDKQERGIRG